MKEIKIDDKTFLYKVTLWGDGECTTFYYPTPIKKLKNKYIFFGPKVEKVFYEEAFVLYGINIESEWYSKKEIREKIEVQLKALNRKEEIEKGEII